MYNDRNFMKIAIDQAIAAKNHGEVPVGAVIVLNNEVVGLGYNQIESKKNATAHAEIVAIQSACKNIKSKYLTDCSMFVTLEPCPMCAGALVLSKLERLIFGAIDPKSGACGTVFNIVSSNKLNHRISITQGVMETECERLLKDFFRSIR